MKSTSLSLNYIHYIDSRNDDYNMGITNTTVLHDNMVSLFGTFFVSYCEINEKQPRPSRKCERFYAFLATSGSDFELFRYNLQFKPMYVM